jgi:hypothetical protein
VLKPSSTPSGYATVNQGRFLSKCSKYKVYFLFNNNSIFSGQSTNPAALAFSGRSINGSSTENIPNPSVAHSQGDILKVMYCNVFVVVVVVVTADVVYAVNQITVSAA